MLKTTLCSPFIKSIIGRKTSRCDQLLRNRGHDRASETAGDGTPVS